MTTREVITLKREGGKSVTCESHGTDVALIVWRKSGGPLLPLILNRMEATRLSAALSAAVEQARQRAIDDQPI